MSPRPAATAARVGPNAILQVVEALERGEGKAVRAHILSGAGLAGYAARPPAELVPECEVAALQRAVRAALPGPRADALLRDAGRATGDYLLRHRIPGFARRGLRALPARLSARCLTAVIRRHAWTFAGSGTFRALAGHPLRVEIRGCPLCRAQRSAGPVCHYYAAVFERLFQALVSPRARAIETACQAAGDRACTFEIGWRR
jgi:divinyl protochlorophyllide a 8-vinyl-reductase